MSYLFEGSSEFSILNCIRIGYKWWVLKRRNAKLPVSLYSSPSLQRKK